jgi:hypothetical protein
MDRGTHDSINRPVAPLRAAVQVAQRVLQLKLLMPTADISQLLYQVRERRCVQQG